MDQVFDDTFRPAGYTIARRLSANPALNVSEFKDRYEISLTIPGIDAKDVKVELHDKVLVFTHEHKEEKEEKDDEGELLRQEYSHFSFSRSVALPKNVDEKSVTAKASKGILKVSVSKLPESQPKQVEIKIED